MRRKIFFRIFAVSLLSVLVMFAFGVLAVHGNAKAILGERLAKETDLACALVHDTEVFADFARYENDDAFRITVFDISGNVLYESDTRAPLENHLGREELENALRGTPKTVERYSKTLGCKMTYYAMKTQLTDGTEILLRLAVRSSRLNEYFGVALPILIVILTVACFAALLLSKLLSERLTEQFSKISDSLRSLNAGDYSPIVATTRETELYSVLTEMNELNANTHAQIRCLEEARKRLNTVLENVSQGIAAIDGSSRILFANKAFADLFRTARTTGETLIYAVDDVALCEKLQRHLGENYAAEYVYKGKTLSVVMRQAENIADDEVYSIVIITDVTQEKTMTKQKSDFFANASHELKTPVAVMQGLSELLLAKETLDDGSKKQVDRIHKESVRLASLISDMLQLSKLESGEAAERVLAEVHLREVAEEAIAELSAKLAEKNITATITGNATLVADGKKIFELLENLCSNAVNYNKDGGEIHIDIQNDEGMVAFSVSDTGIGIEKEHIPRLCERFYRVDKSRSKKTGGTGLGLAIVKHICALYNAEFSIESEPGVGTTVTIVFRQNSEA